MLGHLFKGLQLLHVVIFVLGAGGFLIFWVRTRFWLPKYAHILAAIGLVVGVLCVVGAPDDAPIKKQGALAQVLLALALPAIVYVFFVFYGGQKAAYNRLFRKSSRCPNCKLPVTTRRTDDGVPGSVTPPNQQCPHCGQLLMQ